MRRYKSHNRDSKLINIFTSWRCLPEDETSKIIDAWGRKHKDKYKNFYEYIPAFYESKEIIKKDDKEYNRLYAPGGAYAQIGEHFPVVAVADMIGRSDTNELYCYIFPNIDRLHSSVLAHYPDQDIYFIPGGRFCFSVNAFNNYGVKEFSVFALTRKGARRFGERWEGYLTYHDIMSTTREFEYSKKTGELY